MPIYEYRCDNGHTFDVIQKFADDALDVCEECGAPARRVLHPVAIHFKGSGFYSTDYGRGKRASAEAKAESSGAKSDGAAASGSASGDGAKPAKGDSGSGSGAPAAKTADG